MFDDPPKLTARSPGLARCRDAAGPSTWQGAAISPALGGRARARLLRYLVPWTQGGAAVRQPCCSPLVPPAVSVEGLACVDPGVLTAREVDNGPARGPLGWAVPS